MHRFLRPTLGLAAAFALLAPSTVTARTEVQSFRGDYAVTYLGLTVARSSMTSTLKDNTYSIEGSVSTAGLGKIFDDTNATISVNGRIGDRVVPVRAHTDYRHNKKQKKLTISFAKGNVAGVEEVPPPKPKAADWIPVPQDQLRSVLDPLSAFLVPAKSLEDVCSRPLKVYDGEMRVDLKLAHEATQTIKLDGYEGPAVTCSARFSPVAGYRAGKKSIKFMRDKGRISITFAPLGTTGVYAPVRATVGTEIGTLTLQARKVEIVQ